MKNNIECVYSENSQNNITFYLLSIFFCFLVNLSINGAGTVIDRSIEFGQFWVWKPSTPRSKYILYFFSSLNIFIFIIILILLYYGYVGYGQYSDYLSSHQKLYFLLPLKKFGQVPNESSLIKILVEMINPLLNM